MKSLFTGMLAAVLLTGLPAAVLSDWTENFDSYAPGPLPPQSDWEPWDGDAGAANFNVVADEFLSDPYSLEINGVDDAVHQYTGYAEGEWIYTAWQFIPSDAAGEATYFILMNTYVVGTHNNPDWSVQIACDPAANTVTDEHSLGTTSLLKDEWVEIRVEINLTTDTRTVYYNNVSLGELSWTGAASPGGALNIAAVDLWGNSTTYNVYYDDMSLMPAGPPPTNTPIPPTDTPLPPTATVPTGAPTNTPVPPTETSTPTETPIPPTDTPVIPTDTPVPPTDTPVPPTDTPVPPTDTPSGCDTTGVTIEMPSNFYQPGDECYCNAIVCNAEGTTLDGYPMFVILDVYGLLFFAPSFGDFDYYSETYEEDETIIQVLPSFTWPEGAGSASGILWYGAMTNPEITDLFGEFSMFTFGWGT
ncbi:hypothetical protein JXA40_10735 [bacterium]|nr:hypothetical protein [candidate division CSSED10-310 bacterium]